MAEIETKRIVVTGASGHVGSHIALLLDAEGHDVLNVDVTRPEGDVAGIPWEFADLEDRYQVFQVLKGADVVIHCAEMPGLHRAESPDQLFSHNCTASATLLQVAMEHNLEQFLYTSSAQVYGVWGDPPIDTVDLPVTEETPVRPQQAYALAKVAIENYLRAMCERGFIKGSIFRPPAVRRNFPRNSRWAKYFQLGEIHEPHDGFLSYVMPNDLARAYSLAVAANLEGCEVYNLSANDIANKLPVPDYIREAYPKYSLPEDWPQWKSPFLAENTRKRLGWEPRESVHDETP